MICRELNCLFVHIPKAAGRSIEAFFMQRLGMDRDNDADRVVQAADYIAGMTDRYAIAEHDRLL